MSQDHPLLAKIDPLLDTTEGPAWAAVIAELIDHFDCVVGTIHLLDDDGMLRLTADQGLPPPVRDKVAEVPIGKGMAGIAAARRQPVQVCNLQTDDSGVARPGAKMTQMEGSVAVPMLDGERLHGVLGIAKPTTYEFTANETELLLAIGARAAARLRR